jgi:hypothetical protein
MVREKYTNMVKYGFRNTSQLSFGRGLGEEMDILF